MVIAPEHAAVEALTTADQAAVVKKYRDDAAIKSDRDRQDDRTKKTGAFTGSYAINPVNGKPIPIWIADYVLASYCLLYTSPSPRDATLSRMPSSA